MSRHYNGAMQWRELPVSKEAGRLFGWNPAEAKPKAVRMSHAVHSRIQAHVEADLTRECAGLLFGRWNEESLGTLITATHPATVASSSLTHFIMHPETWLSIWRGLAPVGEVISLAGWYHSHPGHGAFLSATDRTTQELWFRQPWQVAFVVDPIRREEAVFCGAQSVRSELVLEAD